MSEKCPVCNAEIPKPDSSFYGTGGGRQDSFSCPRCGDFTLDCFVLRPDALRDGILEGNVTNIAKLSHWIRTKHESISRNKSSSKSIILTSDLVGKIIRNPLPSIAEQKNRLVLWLGDNSRPGERVRVHPTTHQSVVGAMTPDGFRLVLDHLTGEGLLAGTWPSVSNGETKTSLSFAGWEYYEELGRGASDSHRAFMAMQYGDEQLDNLFKDVLKPAVRQTGFDLFRLIDRPKAGLIDDRLRVEIRAARFLIADLTHENAGAYWEAGYAEGLGKPVIYTCEKKKFEGSKTHFDTNHHLTVLWDLERREDTAKELKATIRATLPAEAKLTDD